MESNSDFANLFDSILKDTTEKKLMTLIFDGKSNEEIIESLLELDSKVVLW